MRLRCFAAVALLFCVYVGQARAGEIFLTGHDPDFHAFLGGNAIGAQHINQRAIAFVQNPAFNPFVATAPKFLFVESSIVPPPGNVDGELGITASGFVPGVNFDKADASTLNSALNKLGKPGGYSAIVVASDFGGILTQAELDILNSRKGDLVNFLNAGGGLYAMAESNTAGLTPNDHWFGFLPSVVSSAQKNQAETGNTLTPFGMSLGLTNSDINGNASHNIFVNTAGLSVVDFDSSGAILSIAGREQVSVIPEPASLLLLGIGGLGLAGYAWRRQKLAEE